MTTVPDTPADLIYLCFPNNPTGAVATKAQLAAWVDYARRNQAVILYDAAYEAYIRDPQIPHSIYEIDGAREVAIEFRDVCFGYRPDRLVLDRQLQETIYQFEHATGVVARRRSWRMTPPVTRLPSMPSGIAATRRSSTACPTPCRRPPPRSIPTPANRRCAR